MSLVCAVCSQPIVPETVHFEIDVIHKLEDGDDVKTFVMYDQCAQNTTGNWDLTP